MALPQLSAEDRRVNLAKAAAARKERAVIREDLKAGKITLAEILKKVDDPIIARLKVVTLLESLPGFGKARAATVLDEVGISATRRVKGLGKRQRDELLALFT